MSKYDRTGKLISMIDDKGRKWTVPELKSMAYKEGKRMGFEGKELEQFVKMLEIESAGWNVRAVSGAGAKGIAQAMDGTAKESKINPFNPDEAIPFAARYLKRWYRYYGDMDQALIAYNHGPGNLDKIRAGKKGIPKETINHVKKVTGTDLNTVFDTTKGGFHKRPEDEPGRPTGPAKVSSSPVTPEVPTAKEVPSSEGGVFQNLIQGLSQLNKIDGRKVVGEALHPDNFNAGQERHDARVKYQDDVRQYKNEIAQGTQKFDSPPRSPLAPSYSPNYASPDVPEVSDKTLVQPNPSNQGSYTGPPYSARNLSDAIQAPGREPYQPGPGVGGFSTPEGEIYGPGGQLDVPATEPVNPLKLLLADTKESTYASEMGRVIDRYRKELEDTQSGLKDAYGKYQKDRQSGRGIETLGGIASLIAYISDVTSGDKRRRNRAPGEAAYATEQRRGRDQERLSKAESNLNATLKAIDSDAKMDAAFKGTDSEKAKVNEAMRLERRHKLGNKILQDVANGAYPLDDVLADPRGRALLTEQFPGVDFKSSEEKFNENLPAVEKSVDARLAETRKFFDDPNNPPPKGWEEKWNTFEGREEYYKILRNRYLVEHLREMATLTPGMSDMIDEMIKAFEGDKSPLDFTKDNEKEPSRSITRQSGNLFSIPGDKF